MRGSNGKQRLHRAALTPSTQKAAVELQWPRARAPASCHWISCIATYKNFYQTLLSVSMFYDGFKTAYLDIVCLYKLFINRYLLLFWQKNKNQQKHFKNIDIYINVCDKVCRACQGSMCLRATLLGGAMASGHPKRIGFARFPRVSPAIGQAVSHIAICNTTRFCILTSDIGAAYKNRMSNKKRNKANPMQTRTTVAIRTAVGTVELRFTDLQQAMERMSEANLATLRRWTRSLERGPARESVAKPAFTAGTGRKKA